MSFHIFRNKKSVYSYRGQYQYHPTRYDENTYINILFYIYMDCRGCPVAGFVGTCHKGLLIYFYEYVNEYGDGPSQQGPCAGGTPEKIFCACHKELYSQAILYDRCKKIFIGFYGIFIGVLWNFYKDSWSREGVVGGTVGSPT